MERERPASRWKSPWVWIGLSCGVLVLGVGGCIVVAGLSGYRAYREYNSRVRHEPVLMVAELVARKEPDVVLVSRDPENHTVTLRNRRTGERFVLGQVGKNQLRIQTEAGEVIPQFFGVSGLMPGRSRDTRLRLGSATGSLPSWVPVHPGAKPRPLYALEGGGVTSGCFIVVPAGPAEEVFRFYDAELARRGFAVTPSSGGFVSASSPDQRSSVFVSPVEGGRPGVLITWSELAGNR